MWRIRRVVPDLAQLPSRSRVFVDTNIFTLHYRNKSVSCTAFIGRIAQGDVQAFVNTQVLSDLLHKLMLVEAVAKNHIQALSAARLKQCFQVNRGVAGQLQDYQTQFENTLAIGLRVLRISKNTLVHTRAERAAHALLTGDSLHLGTMNRHVPMITDIVTHDGDFRHIPNVTVWEPLDVIP